MVVRTVTQWHSATKTLLATEIVVGAGRHVSACHHVYRFGAVACSFPSIQPDCGKPRAGRWLHEIFPVIELKSPFWTLENRFPGGQNYRNRSPKLFRYVRILLPDWQFLTRNNCPTS